MNIWGRLALGLRVKRKEGRKGQTEVIVPHRRRNKWPLIRIPGATAKPNDYGHLRELQSDYRSEGASYRILNSRVDAAMSEVH